MDKNYKVQVKNLHKSYGSNEVLKGISLDVKPNEVVCMIGPSGSGKSTFLRCINKLEEPNSGHIYIDGYDIADPQVNINKVRENIGMVFQHFNLFPNMNVLENITLAPVQLGKMTKEEAEKDAMHYLDLVGLADKAGADPTKLSGGQKQRVAIARALVNDPEVLLADEPTGALDSETSIQVMELLKKVAGNRLVVMVTHNSELARQYSTRIVKLRDGRVTDDSDPFLPEETPEGAGHRQGIKGWGRQKCPF